ncbi:hypothetical protein BCR44DRAFT_59291 [Catenaria anguillulae PL171]|uniref:Uncharacterized protein n=1 Tax=Catenaria anguillulae PL171 TaxID=765915 RepID=A0A1Y2HA54_9FUNG|nr:hypothetical protein BCR44DRAFT_59291 [Catenaria anguillulae PL171]
MQLSPQPFLGLMSSSITHASTSALPCELVVPMASSDDAFHAVKNRSALDWWFSQPDLQLKNSPRKAIETATDNGRTFVLGWWLKAFQSGRIHGLGYYENIMARTTLALHQDYEDRGREKADDSWGMREYLRILTLSAATLIGVCIEPCILQRWLDHAERLAAKSGLPVQDHFPSYTMATIHRASYWGRTDAIDWWLSVSDTLELRYSPHRAVELSVMCPHTYPSTLKRWNDTVNLRLTGTS